MLSHPHHHEVQVVPRRAPSASFDDIGRNANGGPSNLRLQTVPFLSRKFSRQPIRLEYQLIRQRKHLELPVISTHRTANCSLKP
jgi:hypothetical protein